MYMYMYVSCSGVLSVFVCVSYVQYTVLCVHIVHYLCSNPMLQAERGLRQRRHHEGAFEFFGSVDGMCCTFL